VATTELENFVSDDRVYLYRDYLEQAKRVQYSVDDATTTEEFIDVARKLQKT
jgi:hypothetical protein